MGDRSSTIRMLSRSGLEARKALGQNFVVDDRTIDQIVELAEVDPATAVLEVGPGLGALTVRLSQSAKRVIAVEKDTALIPLARANVGDVANVDFVEGDALDMDWHELLAGAEGWTFVANLPYNVAMPIIMSVLAGAPMVERGLVMVQREVAERLAAEPGGRTIGVPSLELAWYADSEVAAIVPPEVFHPVPNVDSALLRFRRRARPSELIDVGQMMELVATAYRKRRKMLRSSLSGLVTPEVFDDAGIAPTARPETLSLEDWVTLAERVSAA